MTQAIQPRTTAAAARVFVTATRDAEMRRESVSRYLRQVFAEITPTDLTPAEAAEVVRALESPRRRVVGTAQRPDVAPLSPIHQVCELLSRLRPTDLAADEALVLLTVLIPAHSRVLAARAARPGGRPVRRLLLHAG